jgi:hypothetical protein
MNRNPSVRAPARSAGDFVVLIILMLGCRSPGSVGTAESGNVGGNQGSVQLPDAGLATEAGGSTVAPPPAGDANCGVSVNNLSQQPADLLIVLDRSTSMTWDMSRDNRECAPSDATCQQRWSTLTRTLDQVVTKSSAKVHWGLKLFATPSSTGTIDEQSSSCAVSPGIDVAIGPDNTSFIRSIIQATQPLGYTPTLPAVKYATQHLAALADSHRHYILLATDGEPNCDGASETTSAATQVNHVVDEIELAVEAGIKVYVVGLGPSTNLRNLDKFAVAGGTVHYYPATSADELSSALVTIVGQIASCEYELADAPPDPNNLGVYLDKQIVPRDASNGWTLGPTKRSVLFAGTYCEGIKAERYTQVQVYFGCPDSQPPSVIP